MGMISWKMRAFHIYTCVSVLPVLLLLSVTVFATDDAHFVSQSVPSTMYVNDVATVSVTMNNPPSVKYCHWEFCCEHCQMCTECYWTTHSNEVWTYPNYRLGSQNPQDNIRWGLSRVSLSSGETVAVGSSRTFTFQITAPPSGVHTISSGGWLKKESTGLETILRMLS